MIRFAEPWLGEPELEAVRRVISSGRMTQGPEIDAFEAEFLTTIKASDGHAIAVSSCAAGMFLLLQYQERVRSATGNHLRILTPALTHPAIFDTATALNFQVRLTDVDASGQMSFDQAAVMVDSPGWVVVPVHYLGGMAPVRELVDYLEPLDPFVIEDCALALGLWDENNVHVGLIGHAGVFSFYPSKHITTGEGGMIVTMDEELADWLRAARTFGTDAAGNRATQWGFNFRMTEMQAAMGRAQLQRLPHIWNLRRRNYKIYAGELGSFDSIDLGRHAAYGYGTLVPDGVSRQHVRDLMAGNGVETSVHYLPLLSNMPWLASGGAHPMAERIVRRVITLPVGPHLTVDDIGRVALVFREAVKKVEKLNGKT